MNEKKKTPKQSLIEKINEKLDIAPEAMPGATLVSISGRQKVSVEGRVKILLYSQNQIILSLGNQTLEVLGKGLLCSSYYGRQLTLVGQICSVSFLED